MNQNTSIALKNFAPTLLRLGISIVFLWFGSQQLLNTGMWLGLIPSWVTSFTGLTAATIVHFTGSFEIIFGLALLVGYFTRVVALLLALHLLSILVDVGYGATGVRDFGLLIATIAVFLNGADSFTLDKKMEKTESAG